MEVHGIAEEQVASPQSVSETVALPPWSPPDVMPAKSHLQSGLMRFLNLSIALMLFVPAVILIALVYLFRMVYERRLPDQFLYAGERLGLHRKLYTIYKIRTLKTDASFEQQGVILPPGSGRELRFGVFLRDSRLDELPQLWNVIRGDMNLVGPRPMRPCVYQELVKTMPHCDVIFLVKPGLTGYSQFLTPSHTPRRIRIAIDSHFVRSGSHPLGELLLIVWTATMVVNQTVKSFGRLMGVKWILFQKYRSGREQRKLHRHRPHYAWIQMADMHFTVKDSPLIAIYDIDYRALSFVSAETLDVNVPLHFYLIGHKHCRTGPEKRARCRGYVSKQYPVPGRSDDVRRYVVFYEPVSEFQRYMVDHYILHETVA